MFNVHWKVLNDKTKEYDFYSRKVRAKNPDMARGVILSEYPSAIFQKIKKADEKVKKR